MTGNLPDGVTVEAVSAAIENAVGMLSKSFTFGIYDIEDVKQEGRMEGWRVMKKYDASRPLDNYIFSCIRNRLIRLRRDKLRRNDPPCKLCHEAEGSHSLHADGVFCPSYLAWKKRNDAKANLMRPLGLEHVSETRQERLGVASPSEEVELNDMLSKIDAELSVELRSTYLQMRAGKSVSKSKRLAVEAAVREILSGEV